MMRAAALAASVAGASGHGALTFPRPRQALDKELKGKGGRPLGAGCPVGPGGRESNGQSCYWFSNGCNIGCDACDGTLTSAGHDDESYSKFLFRNMTKAQLRAKKLTGADTIAELWSPKPGDMTIDPSLKPVSPHVMPKKGQPNPKPVIASNCGKIGVPTMCDSRLRTLNTLAECKSPEDIYQLSPWRAPGSAPVIDSCGSAGGRLPGQPEGIALAVFTNSSLAFEGQKGSTLPAMPSQATWKR